LPILSGKIKHGMYDVLNRMKNIQADCLVHAATNCSAIKHTHSHDAACNANVSNRGQPTNNIKFTKLEIYYDQRCRGEGGEGMMRSSFSTEITRSCTV